MIETDITGLKELQEALKQLPREIQQRPLRSALAAGAKVILDEAKRLAPQGETGNLRKALYRYRSRSRSGIGQETYLVGVRKGKKDYVDSAKNRRLGRVGKKYTVEGEAFYWRFIEFGTSKKGARPFLRPAFESKKMEAIDVFKKRMAIAIEKTAQKMKK